MNTLRPQIYLDFDDCLYNSHEMYRLFMEEIVSSTDLSMEDVIDGYKRSRGGGPTPEKHLTALELKGVAKDDLIIFYIKLIKDGTRFLFKDVTAACRRLSEFADLHLLSYGQSKTQFRKWDGVAVLHSFFKSTQIVGDEGKGKTFEGLSLEQKSLPTFFIDDKPRYLIDTNKRAPFVHTVQIIRFPERQEVDHETIIHSLSEIPALIDLRLSP